MSEKPVRVRRHRSGKHQLETRVFAREINETFCAQPGCRFRGKHAAQGVCHTRLGRRTQSELEARFRDAEEMMAELRNAAKRAKMSPRTYARYLERHMESAWMNAEFGLDELIRLRAQNAVLRARAGTWR